MKKLFLLGVACLMLCTACASPTPSESDFFAMDTYMTCKVYGARASEALDACKKEALRLDKLLSVTDTDSEIYVLNRDGAATLSKETVDLLRETVACAKETGGAFDAALYPLTLLWGFTGETPRVPTQQEIGNALLISGCDKLRIDDDTVSLPEGGGVDLGGAAKGYASARMAEICAEHGVKHAILSLGGNVYAVGTRIDGTPWRVGVQDPFDESGTIGTLLVSDTAVITTGGYERYFEQDGVRYHHIIDPATGYPAASGLASVTVITPDGTKGDMLSTALFVMGLDASVVYWCAHSDIAIVFVLDDGTVCYTENVPWETVSPQWRIMANNVD